MKELIGFEIKKLLNKMLIWACFAGLGLMTVTMTANWLAPPAFSVQEDRNGQKVILEGHDAILRNQEIAAQYEGLLTTDKVKQILDTFSFSPAMMEAQHIEPERQRHYVHNLLFDTLARNGFANLDGSYNGTEIDDVFGPIASDLVMGYSSGWEGLSYTLIYDFLVWGCVLVILLSPVFSDEYTRGTDALILTGIQGRKKCPAAKIIASYLVSLTGSLILLGIHFLLFFLWHGTKGLESSVQLGELGLFFNTPYVISWKEAFGLSCLLWLGATAVLTSLVLLISAWAKSSFSALVISFTLFCLPMFLPPSGSQAVNLICKLMPINQMQVFYLFAFDRLNLGQWQMNVAWISIPMTLAAVVPTAILSKRSFARHQVR